MAQLYHGFRGFERILNEKTLLANRLQVFRPIPDILYLDPSLIRLVGDSKLHDTQQFDYVDMVVSNLDDIIGLAKSDFGVKLSIDPANFRSLHKVPTTETDEFYRSNCIYFSDSPLNYEAYLSMDVPDSIVQKSPQGWPVVSGKLPLDDSVKLHVRSDLKETYSDMLKKYYFTCPLVLF